MQFKSLYKRTPGTLAAILAASAFSFAVTSVGHAADKIDIGLSTKAWFPSFVAELAQSQGFFKKADVDARITVYQSGSEALTAIAAGAADLISTNPNIVADGRDAGVDVKLVQLLATRNSGWQIVVPKKTKITKAPDLAGRNVGITSAGSNTDLLAHWTMRKYDMKFTTIPLGGGGLIPNLISGNVDAIVVYPPLSYKATLDGDGTTLIDFGSEMPAHLEAGWGASGKYMKDDSATLKRALGALAKTVAFIQSRPGKVIPMIAKYDGVSEAVAKQEYKATFKTLSTSGVMKADLVDQSLKLFGTGKSKKAPAADELFTNKFVETSVSQ